LKKNTRSNFFIISLIFEEHRVMRMNIFSVVGTHSNVIGFDIFNTKKPPTLGINLFDDIVESSEREVKIRIIS